MRASRSVHPLLLEPTYWRDRLQKMKAVHPSVSVLPRPDLSGNGKVVVEFRMRAHDGTQLWGLLARSHWHQGARPAQIRVIGPAERPEVDKSMIEQGVAELIFQESAGRCLPDRVLDVLQIAQMAVATDGIDGEKLSFFCPSNGHLTDEALIAEQLIAGNFC